MSCISLQSCNILAINYTQIFPIYRSKKIYIFDSPFALEIFYTVHFIHRLYSSPSIIRMIKSRKMRWAGHVARMGAKRNWYRILVGKPEGKRPLGRPRRRWVDNIKMDLREIGWYDMDWIDLAQDMDQWRALVNTIMNLRVP
jgi:hypothetical protein